jgi:redox-sensitive bicupin YhaK (pirin superfamily)
MERRPDRRRQRLPAHPHRDMEIITYVREGAISHQDSLGNKGRTEAGDVQVMSAGTGIVHSEYNLEDVDTRIFQIWIVPERTGEAPSWGSRPFPKGERGEGFVTLASGREGDGDSLQIRTDARLVAATLRAGKAPSTASTKAGAATWCRPRAWSRSTGCVQGPGWRGHRRGSGADGDGAGGQRNRPGDVA